MIDEDTPRSIDVSSLPAELVALIDGLGLGEDVAVTRDGEPIATITATTDTVAVEPDDDIAPPADGYDDVTVVVTAMKLSAAARSALSARLGADYIVLDIRSAPRTADVVLVPPSSPTLIRTARSQFPNARVVVTEIGDDELGVSYEGPVRRMLDAGAEAYLSSTTVSRLARQLDVVVTRQHELTAGPLAIEAPGDDA